MHTVIDSSQIGFEIVRQFASAVLSFFIPFSKRGIVIWHKHHRVFIIIIICGWLVLSARRYNEEEQRSGGSSLLQRCGGGGLSSSSLCVYHRHLLIRPSSLLIASSDYQYCPTVLLWPFWLSMSFTHTNPHPQSSLFLRRHLATACEQPRRLRPRALGIDIVCQSS